MRAMSCLVRTTLINGPKRSSSRRCSSPATSRTIGYSSEPGVCGRPLGPSRSAIMGLRSCLTDPRSSCVPSSGSSSPSTSLSQTSSSIGIANSAPGAAILRNRDAGLSPLPHMHGSCAMRSRTPVSRASLLSSSILRTNLSGASAGARRRPRGTHGSPGHSHPSPLTTPRKTDSAFEVFRGCLSDRRGSCWSPSALGRP